MDQCLDMIELCLLEECKLRIHSLTETQTCLVFGSGEKAG